MPADTVEREIAAGFTQTPIGNGVVAQHRQRIEAGRSGDRDPVDAQRRQDEEGQNDNPGFHVTETQTLPEFLNCEPGCP